MSDGRGIPLASHPSRTGGPRDVPSPDGSATDSPSPVSRKQQASVLASAFIAIVLTIGYNQCYGVFQEHYLSPTQTLLRPAPSSSKEPPTAVLAFVGTLGSGLTWAGSLFVNPIVSRIEHIATLSPAERGSLSRWRRILARLTVRYVTVAGVVLMSAGFALASLSTQIWHLLLTQGLLYGLGSSLLYFPLLSPAPEYFTFHRATAMGVILAGGGVGGVAFSPALRALLSTLGAAATLRIWALFVLLVGVPVALAVPRPRFPAMAPSSANEEDAEQRTDAGRRLTHIPRSLLKRPTLVFSAAAAFLQAAGAVLPLSFIPSYSVAIGFDASKGALLLAVSNAINAASRIASGYAGDRLGRQNALVLTALFAVVSVFALWFGSVANARSDSVLEESAILASTTGMLWLAFIVTYNLAAGGYYALFPATIAEVFGIRQYAAVNGFILVVRGLGTMLGSPVGGRLLGETGLSKTTAAAGYATVVAWDGGLLAGAAICLVGVRWADAKGKGWSWKA